mmetsp:Transcript_41364/g.106672  ORF Transcript_41364/g.106672 Transcript_41364/m.106672 type:complete len:223 (+) Transcript_41364:127-795(+)
MDAIAMPAAFSPWALSVRVRVTALSGASLGGIILFFIANESNMGWLSLVTSKTSGSASGFKVKSLMRRIRIMPRTLRGMVNATTFKLLGREAKIRMSWPRISCLPLYCCKATRSTIFAWASRNIKVMSSTIFLIVVVFASATNTTGKSSGTMGPALAPRPGWFCCRVLGVTLPSGFFCSLFAEPPTSAFAEAAGAAGAGAAGAGARGQAATTAGTTGAEAEL